MVTDTSVDLVDICLPTHLHADIAVRAMEAGNDVLIELPLADTLDNAHRVVAAQPRRAGGRSLTCSPASARSTHQIVADQRYGALQVLELESHTARLWEGYDLGLQTLALDMMHASFDLIAGLLSKPDTIQATGIEGASGRGSAAEVLLGYPSAIARCTGSSLMPAPYGMSGASRATFAGAVIFQFHQEFAPIAVEFLAK